MTLHFGLNQLLYSITATILPLIAQSYFNDTYILPRTDLAVPLFAAKDSHHVHVYVGTPPQRRIVIVDTGSRLLVFPCQPCSQCGTNHVSGNFFDPKISSTDVTNDCKKCVFKRKIEQCSGQKCVFHQAYTEGSSMNGFEMEDITWLGTQNMEQSVKMYMHTAVPMTFGCQTSEKGLIATQFADGIMGLSSKVDNIITKMFHARSISNYAFSLCLTRENGVMSIGGTSSLLKNRFIGVEDEKVNHADNGKRPIHLEEMNVVPIFNNRGYYSIQIIDFHIGNFTLKSKEQITMIFNEGKGTIVDSGTTDTYLPKKIASMFRQVWLKINGRQHSNERASYSYTDFQKLPNIAFTLENGYHWTVKPNEYMEEVDASQDWQDMKLFYNRIYLDESKGAVLGANAMFNHDILFDITNKVIGIAASKCVG